MAEIRAYPTACTSMYCGKGSESCPSCRFYPALQEFKAWQSRTGAVRTDPVWCPSIYEAQRPDPERRSR